jgi:hypothetical protein
MNAAASYIDPRVTAAATYPLQPPPSRSPIEKGQVFFEILLAPRGPKGEEPYPALTTACLGERPSGAVVYIGTESGEVLSFDPSSVVEGVPLSGMGKHTDLMGDGGEFGAVKCMHAADFSLYVGGSNGAIFVSGLRLTPFNADLRWS